LATTVRTRRLEVIRILIDSVFMKLLCKFSIHLFIAGVFLFQTCVCEPSLNLPVKLFSRLKSEDFKTRESAERELLDWGRLNPELAKRLLFQKSRFANDPEIRQRCLNVLRDLVVDDYLKHGEGYLGVSMREAFQQVPNDLKLRGVVIVSGVMPDSSAEKAGIEVNDVIVGLDDTVWYAGARDHFADAIRNKNAKSTVLLRVLRAGKILDLTAILGRRLSGLDSLLLNSPNENLRKMEKAEKNAYFLHWLSLQKISK
jgi:hypothetical protein